MDIEKIFEVESDDMAFKSIGDAVAEARRAQSQRLSDNVQAVLAALGKMKGEIEGKYDDIAAALEQRIASIKDGQDGAPGRDGRPGRDGVDGKPGRDGRDGKDGAKGADGMAGQDGVSVVNAYLDFDNSLVIELSDGRQINAGEVLPPDLADKLKVIVNTSTGGVGLPEQTGNSGKFLKTDGINLVWDTVGGGGGGGGDVTGPASSTDNAIARFDSTTGKVIQNSSVTVSDAGDIAGVSSLGVANYVDFDTTPTVTNAEGRLYWNADQTTLAVGLTSTISADVGQTLYARATNAEATTINKGQVVYQFGASGDRVSVKLAYNTGDATSAKTLGVAAENIAAGQTGMILCQGVLGGLDLSAYTAGDTLYLGATAGSLTATKPYAPNHLVYIGTVERANAGNGRLYVRVQNGYELEELHNVSAQSPSNGQLIIYNATTSLWEKNTITAGSGISVTNGAGSITIAATGGSGTGDVVGPASSTDNAVARFDGTTGKLIQNSSFVVNDSGEVTVGVWKGTELTVAYGGTGVSSITGLIKGDGQNPFSAAVAGTDYQAAITATGILKGGGSGSVSAATAGTDYVTPSGTETLTNKTISTDNNTINGLAASSFVLSNASGVIDGSAAQKAIPSGAVVGTTDTQTLSGKTLVDPAVTGTILEDVFTITDGAAFEIDPANGSIQLITLGASRTPKATNFLAGEAITLMVDDGTSYTLTWTDATFGGSGVVWKTDSGVAPTLNTTGYTVIVLWKVGTQVYGARVGNS